MLGVVILVLVFVLNLFFAALICRLVLDWIQVLAREWRPRGPVLFFAEGIYTVTDPPLKFLRRLIPPLSLGWDSPRHGVSGADSGCLVSFRAVVSYVNVDRSVSDFRAVLHGPDFSGVPGCEFWRAPI